MKISDEVWQVIKDTYKKYDDWDVPDSVREAAEEIAEIKEFDGGVFVSYGNEFDLFVLPERQAKWNVRGEINSYLKQMHEKYGDIIVRINENNTRSLRLAKGFGFKEISNNEGEITLERKL
jgi:predicted PolB exonuclease-like 3'-5' exonuclease